MHRMRGLSAPVEIFTLPELVSRRPAIAAGAE
jgi:hypothetical protein